MEIYIDFDRTLFDCDKFLGDLYGIIQKYKIPKNVFKDSQIQCKKLGFNPNIILQKVEKVCLFSHDVYRDIDKLLENTNAYLYTDTIDFLKYLKKNNYRVIILTKGNIEYQQKKIANANISGYYDDLIITMSHKGKLDINYHDSVFIDDNPKEIKSILRKKPKKIIRIRRDNSKYSNTLLEKDIETVNSLQEIIDNNLL